MSTDQHARIMAVSLPGSLHIIAGGFIEINAADENAVVLTYVGGSTRTLTEEQSDSFLRQVGLKASPILTPKRTFGNR